MDPLHNPLPPWAQPPPTTAAAAAPYSSVTFPHADPAAVLQPHSYQTFPNFPAPTPVPTAPAPSPAPAPPPAPAASAVQAPPGFHSGPTPSYAEMIFSAISALKERDGSSKIAISKYIEHAYQGQLPPTHSALLTQNLKQLKSNGMLVMVKKSYKLPRSDFTANINDLPDPSLESFPQPATQQQSGGGTVSASAGPKRGRGRPPKAKLTSAETVVLPNGQVPQLGSDSQPPGFVANGQQAAGHYSADVTVEMEEGVHGDRPVAEEDGSGSVKRGRGRPPKMVTLGVDAGGIVIGKRGRGRPPKSGLGLGSKKRSPGRPRKPKPKTVAAGSGTNGYKKRPGRPPKNQANSVVVPYANVEGMAPPSVPRPRGRPRKGTGSIAAGVGVGGLSEKRAGVSDGVLEPPRRSARPVGRPKKYLDESLDETDAQDAEEFRRKLLFFQSRVREVAGVLRPQLSNEAPRDVVKAVEDLEKLASINIDQELKAELVMQSLNPHHHDHLDVEAAVNES